MKRTVISVIVIVMVIFTFSATIFAAGTPATHELSGRDFGQAVKMLAKTEPGAVSAHVQMCKDMMEMEEEEMHMHGVPAMHELSGRDFGQAVKMLAKTEPGAVAAHVKMCKDMMD